ncbi:hypothetical protein [Thermus sp. NEB1569]|uniref:hypothetical protein n=1 Tax=Thermus sp. NEB1569 TaxID=2918899 RepID=UPI001EFBEE7E|nr:hypothetical protein [Thermus sp. NEB1569]ULR39704.1 hypothetical protein MI302_00415 [Thermus sp. NEB1569]
MSRLELEAEAARILCDWSWKTGYHDEDIEAVVGVAPTEALQRLVLLHRLLEAEAIPFEGEYQEALDAIAALLPEEGDLDAWREAGRPVPWVTGVARTLKPGKETA